MILVTTNPLDGSKVDVYVADSNVNVDGLMTGNIVTYDVSNGTVIVSDKQVPIINGKLAMTSGASRDIPMRECESDNARVVDTNGTSVHDFKNGIKVDLNTIVRVSLSDEVIDILVKYYDDCPTIKTNQPFDSTYIRSKMGIDGRIEMTMWEVMSIFGEYMHIGDDKMLDIVVPVPVKKINPHKS